MSNGTDPNGSTNGNSATARTGVRQVSGDQSFTAISPDYEVRVIVVARGMTFHNDTAGEYAIPDYLVSKIGADVVTLADGTIVYSSDAQHVTYVIEQVTTKSDFRASLGAAGVHVIYCGHARFGQGMCFGGLANDQQGEDWGLGTDTNNTGLWRVGYPFVGLPIGSDVLHHGYTINAVPGSQDKPDPNDCHPHVRQVYGQMSVIAISDFDPNLPQFLGSSDTSSGFWGYDATSEAGKFERHILVNCGWTGTDEDPMDLGGTTMNCKVFACIACSTFTHHYRIVRFLAGWQKSGDNQYAYWTTNATAPTPMTAFYLHRLLTYPSRNDFQPWQASLDYAVRKANQDYINFGAPVSSQLI